ncbi:hypothetical protein EV586_102396 [Tumebacillus sp. BK434]|uniref:hypothetical protein n=1 Tax=Tumebacillus sp. BK434 TaxID=2512169 RepID=UPI001049D9B8|nr:hypothetical protein [Tumebacillus sp. BK434]TCP57949.1 hypothetical protein EV586_102396 [Tumebacillus sp. BK434]
MLETGSRRTGSKPGVSTPGARTVSRSGGAGHAAQLKILQLQKTIGNRAVLQLLRAQQSATSSQPIQRVIEYDPDSATKEKHQYPSTWTRMLKLKSKAMKKRAWDTHGLAEAVLNKMGYAGVEEKKLQDIWGKVAKDENQSYNMFEDQEELAQEMAKRYVRSKKSQAGFQKRSGETSKMLAHLRSKEKRFIFKNSPKNPMMIMKDDDLSKFSYDPATSKEDQIQKQLSTVLLHELPGGIEVQAALAKNKSDVLVSSNMNAENGKIESELGITGTEDILDLAADLLEHHNLESTKREDAMKDHVMRHALKLYDRLKNYLNDDATVTVPADVDVKFDGRHAEIRIEKSAQWNKDDYRLPTGTKYPCMGCRLYFHSSGHDTGNRMGGLWVTNSALSTQLLPQLEKGIKIGALGKELETVAKLLATQYQQMIDQHDVKMGRGKTKSGEYTFDRQADSESELDDTAYDRIRENIKKRKRKRKVKDSVGGHKHAHTH